METIARFLLLLLLVLIQVTVVPVNFAFAAVVATILLVKDFEFVFWLILVALLVSLFGDLNFGVVLIAFTTSLLLLLMARKIVPENRITKVLIVLLALPLVNFSLILVANILR